MVRYRRRHPITSPTVAVAYIRVSTSKQDLGPDAQRAAISEWAKRKGVTVAATFEDIGVSGTTELLDRKRAGLRDALIALTTHGAGFLVAAKHDRFARDTYVMGSIEREAMKAHAAVVTADGDATRLERGVRVLFSEHERNVIAQRTKDALAVKRAKGEALGNVPYGWRRAADGLHLEEHPEEQRFLRRLRELSAAATGRHGDLSRITRTLNAEGFRNRAGQPFVRQVVRRILTADQLQHTPEIKQ